MAFLKTKGQHQLTKAMNQQNGEKKEKKMPRSNMIQPYYKPLKTDEEIQNTVEFDSVFESGNLALALKVTPQEYNLLLQNDVNTNGHT